MNRRTFLGTITAGSIVASRVGWASAEHKVDPIGVQLYTVRESMKKDLPGTIAKVAQVGYKEVEFAGYFDHSPKEIRSILDQNGLKAPSAHIEYSVLDEKWPGVLEAAQVVGHQYIVCPWIDDEVRKQNRWKEAAAKFNKAAETSKKAGIQFAYHNHHFEFVKVDGKYAYDILLEETDPKLVQMEMDLCWMNIAGQDPINYFDRYPGRFPMVHVKDVKKIPPKQDDRPVNFDNVFPEMTSVGNGVIDFKKIFAQSDKAGIKHYFVENDYPKSEFEDIRASYEYLHKLQF
jgi:sugar phosphate isomerase/epimerase